MDKTSRFLRILNETVGIPPIIAFIFGVPAMSVCIWAIWQALTPSHKIIAAISGFILVAMVILFVYFQTRKKLYVIPNLLYKMHSIVHTHIVKLKLYEMNEQDFLNWLSLFRIDIDRFKAILSMEDEAEISHTLEVLYPQFELANKDMSHDDAEVIVNYFLSKLNLPKILEDDVAYNNTMIEINRMRLLIPNEEIALAVDEFIKESEGANCLSILLSTPTDILSKILSPKLDAKAITVFKNIDRDIMLSLTKVRESINKYYKNA